MTKRGQVHKLDSSNDLYKLLAPIFLFIICLVRSYKYVILVVTCRG